jgi:hypothetical protein
LYSATLLTVWWTNKSTNGQQFIILLLSQCPYILTLLCYPQRGSCPVSTKLHKHLNAELVIFLKLYICFVVKIMTMLKRFSCNKIILSWKSYIVLSCGRIYNLSDGAVVMATWYVHNSTNRQLGTAEDFHDKI